MSKDFEEIEIDLEIEDFVALATIAHERDITLNQLVNEILEEALKKHEN